MLITSAIKAPAVLVAMRTSTVTWSCLGGVLIVFRPKMIAVLQDRMDREDDEELKKIAKIENSRNRFQKSGVVRGHNRRDSGSGEKLSRSVRRHSRSQEVSEAVLLDGDFSSLVRILHPSEIISNLFGSFNNDGEDNFFASICRRSFNGSVGAKVSDVVDIVAAVGVDDGGGDGGVSVEAPTSSPREIPRNLVTLLTGRNSSKIAPSNNEIVVPNGNDEEKVSDLGDGMKSEAGSCPNDGGRGHFRYGHVDFKVPDLDVWGELGVVQV